MNNFIETPTIGEILSEEFLIPLGMSAYKLARKLMFQFLEYRIFSIIVGKLQ